MAGRISVSISPKYPKRFGMFVNLPLPTLDRLALQARLNEIGRNLPHTA